MFELENLSAYGIDIDFSNVIPKEAKQESKAELISKLNLGLLKNSSFSELHIVLSEMSKLVPELEYNRSIGNNYVRFGLFNDGTRLRLIIA